MNIENNNQRNRKSVSDRFMCPLCSSRKVDLFLDIEQMPLYCNVLGETREEALRTPKGDIRLGYCGVCSHIYNYAFDPERIQYSQEYENSLYFSNRFQEYAVSIADHLIERYDVRNKEVIEIGCGKGDFLMMLCDRGGNRGIGFDPSYEDEREDGKKSDNVTFIRDYYSKRYAGYGADLICCMQVLEHVQNPRDFMLEIHQASRMREGTIFFFEVPNVLYSLRDLGIWDFIYEHCSYFSPKSLSYLFDSCGFDIYELKEAYGGQFLSIESGLSNDSSATVKRIRPNQPELDQIVPSFVTNYLSKVESWRSKMLEIEQNGQRAVVWGGGSKGVTILNVLGVEGVIEFVVDINPFKQGKYVPGTGQRVVSPDFLKKYRPDIIIIMNSIYRNEIQQKIEDLQIYAKLETV